VTRAKTGTINATSGPAIREVVALGFVEITKAGRAGNAEYRTPNIFRLTYRHTDYADPTHEWRRIKSAKDALLIADAARKSGDKNYNNRRTKIRNPVPETITVTVPVNALASVPETITTPIVRKPSLLTISPSGYCLSASSSGSGGSGEPYW
jgi:glutathione synthase/RimK-type ligase-like ATP-grasp enzyme